MLRKKIKQDDMENSNRLGEGWIQNEMPEALEGEPRSLN